MAAPSSVVAVPDPDAAPLPAPVGWKALLKAAELDAPGVLRPDPEATPTPPVFADRTAVWTGSYPDRPDLTIRVEAGCFRGRPVYFRITHPEWGAPPRDRPVPIVNQGARFFAVVDTIFGLFTAAVVFFALRNIRRGRADLRGALVLAAVIITFQMTFWLLAGGHFSAPGLAWPLFISEFAMVLFGAWYAAVNYLALEPVVRRRCPHRLTAWTRLAAGRWRDPLVSRDVLIGLLAGVVVSLDFPAMPFFPSRWGPTVVEPHSFTHPVGLLAGHIVVAVGVTWIYAGIFGVLLTVGRRDWVAAAAMAALVLIPDVLGSGFPLFNQVFQVVRVAVAMAVFLRFGILAMIACYLAATTVQAAPLTLDPSAWYFGASLTYLLALVGLAGYAAYMATEGRLLGGGSAGDD